MDVNEPVDIFVDRAGGSARQDGGGGGGGGSGARNNEVYLTPSGNSSIVVMEDDPNDNSMASSAPIPAREFPKFRPPPNLARRDDRRQDGGHREEPVTRNLLPAEDLMQYADLDALANPEKTAAPSSQASSSAPAAPSSGGGRVEPDRPVPAKFPPAPQKRGRPAAKKPASSNTTAVSSVRVASPAASSSTASDLRSTTTTTTTTFAPPKASPAPSRERREEKRDERREERGSRREEDKSSRRDEEETGFGGYELESESRRQVFRTVPEFDDSQSGREDRSGRREDRSGRDDRSGRSGRSEGRSGRSREGGRSREAREERTPREERRGGGFFDDPYQESSPRRGREGRDREGGREAELVFDEGRQEYVEQRSRRPKHSDAVTRLPPEEVQKRREEEEKKEKMQLLHKLYQFEQRGHRMANSFSMDSNIDELRFEVAKIRNEESAKHSVRWYKVFLMIIVSTVETLNTRFDPFGLRLKGWSKDMNAKKEDLDDCFHRLHDKYSSKTSIEPELELAFAFFGGCFMYHLQNAAENYGELGSVLTSVVGGHSVGGKPQQKAAPPVVSANAPGWARQPDIMTNVPFFGQSQTSPMGQGQQAQATTMGQQQQMGTQGQQQQVQQHGQSGRRIMRGPPIPSGAGSVGMDVLNMVNSPLPDQDVPIDMSVPLPSSIGGHRVERPATQGPTRPTTSGAAATKAKSARASSGARGRATAPAPNVGRQITI